MGKRAGKDDHSQSRYADSNTATIPRCEDFLARSAKRSGRLNRRCADIGATTNTGTTTSPKNNDHVHESRYANNVIPPPNMNVPPKDLHPTDFGVLVFCVRGPEDRFELTVKSPTSVPRAGLSTTLHAIKRRAADGGENTGNAWHSTIDD